MDVTADDLRAPHGVPDGVLVEADVIAALTSAVPTDMSITSVLDIASFAESGEAGCRISTCAGPQPDLLAIAPRRRADDGDHAVERFRSELDRWFPQLATDLPAELYHLTFLPGEPTPLPWRFRCNVCGTEVHHEGAMPATRSCPVCISNTRSRSIIALVSRIAHGCDLALPDFPPRPDMRIVGVSDWPRYARGLARVFDYVNTSVHDDPRLDLTEPLPAAFEECADIVIAGDVLEHVAPPVSTAVANLQRILRPGGHAIVTVPYRSDREHLERYPDLHVHRIEVGADGEPELVNTRRDGVVERFGDLVFHGPGRSLAMREFTLTSILDALLGAGFVDIELGPHRLASAGVATAFGKPVPLLARKPLAADSSGDPVA